MMAKVVGHGEKRRRTEDEKWIYKSIFEWNAWIATSSFLTVIYHRLKFLLAMTEFGGVPKHSQSDKQKTGAKKKTVGFQPTV